MKKIFITILLVLIPLNVQAINNQKTFSETKLCKYYKEEKVFTDYLFEGENPKEYPFKSKETITKKYEEDKKPQDKPNRIIIKEEQTNNYKKLKKVNRMVIKFKGEPLLYQLEIYEKNQKIKYTYSKYNPKIYESIQNNNFIYFERILLDTLDLELPHEINPLDITIKLYIQKENDFEMTTYLYPKEMTEKYDSQNPKHETYYIKNNINITYQNRDDEMDIKKIQITKQDIKTYNYDGDTITTKDELAQNIYHKISTTTKYTYQDTLYKYYKIEKQYQEGYHNNLKGYIKDEKNCITKNENNIFKQPIIKNPKNISITKEQKPTTNINEQNQNSIEQDSLLPLEKRTNIEKENNLSYKESKKKTKTNKILYILPVIILSIIFLLGYLIYNLLKER